MAGLVGFPVAESFHKALVEMIGGTGQTEREVDNLARLIAEIEIRDGHKEIISAIEKKRRESGAGHDAIWQKMVEAVRAKERAAEAGAFEAQVEAEVADDGLGRFIDHTVELLSQLPPELDELRTQLGSRLALLRARLVQP